MVSCLLWMAVAVVMYFGGAQSSDNDIMSPCNFTKEKGENEDVAKLLPVKNLVVTVKDNNFLEPDENYNYTISMCNNAGDPGDTAAVVQQREDGKMEPTVIGRYNDTFLKSGSRWMLLEFRSGDKYNNACNKSNRVASLMFICNDAVNDFTHVSIVEENSKLHSDCYYMFEVQHCLACEDGCDTYYRRFSPGSIILISAFSLVAAYLLFGFIYMRCIAKAVGWEQIPNYHFWREVGHLQSDGCALVCRCQTVGDSERSYYDPASNGREFLRSAASSANGYQGIDDNSGGAPKSTSLLDEHDSDERLLAA